MAFATPGNNIPGYKQLTPIEAMRVGQLNEMVLEAREKGWKPASVINLAPWTQNPQDVLLNGLRISGVPLSKEMWAASPKLKLRSGLEIPFVHHVITLPGFNVLEQVVGPIETAQGAVKNKTWWPYDFAESILSQNNSMQHRGGMVIYKGGHVPLSNHGAACLKVIAKESEFPGDTKGCGCVACVQDYLEEAHAGALRYYDMLFTQAASAHASGDKVELRNIRNHHRWAIRYMRNVGVLQVDPPFLTEILTSAQKAPTFCVCGKEAPRGALVCAACHYILEPLQAFKKGVFDLDSPGAVTALRRLKKDELKELGLYPNIKPMDEYITEKFAESEDSQKSKRKARELGESVINRIVAS